MKNENEFLFVRMSQRITSLPEALAEIARLERLVARLYRALDPTERRTAPPPPPTAVTTAAAPRKRAFPNTDTLIIYTDGSSLGNGRSGARAGCAVTTNRGFRWQARAPGPQTNNRAELYAAIVGMAQARDCERAILNTDSEYVSDNANMRLAGWIKSGWKKKDGSPVLNEDLWRMVWALMTERREKNLLNITLVWVKAHAGNAENERVDDLAKAAAELPLDTTAPFYPPFPGIEDVLAKSNLSQTKT